MNNQEKLKAVENRIRQDLPYLTELTEGCFFKNYHDSKNYSECEIVKVNAFEVIYKYMSKEYQIRIDRYSSDSFIERFSTHIKIIGHPVKLNDVLKWLKLYESKVNSENKYPEDPYVLEFRYNIHHDLEIFDDGGLLSSINLDKLLLSDQSEEFINFLYELL